MTANNTQQQPQPQRRTTTTTTTKSRRIRFHDRVQFKTIRHVSEFTDEEISNGWYDKDDFASMSDDVSEIASLFNKGIKTRNGENLCIRGLEHIVEEELADYRAEKMINSIDAVLDEQEEQWDEGKDDPDAIAQIYEEYSKPLLREAHQIGLNDAKEGYKTWKEELLKEQQQQQKVVRSKPTKHKHPKAPKVVPQIPKKIKKKKPEKKKPTKDLSQRSSDDDARPRSHGTPTPPTSYSDDDRPRSHRTTPPTSYSDDSSASISSIDASLSSMRRSSKHSNSSNRSVLSCSLHDFTTHSDDEPYLNNGISNYNNNISHRISPLSSPKARPKKTTNSPSQNTRKIPIGLSSPPLSLKSKITFLNSPTLRTKKNLGSKSNTTTMVVKRRPSNEKQPIRKTETATISPLPYNNNNNNSQQKQRQKPQQTIKQRRKRSYFDRKYGTELSPFVFRHDGSVKFQKPDVEKLRREQKEKRKNCISKSMAKAVDDDEDDILAGILSRSTSIGSRV